MTRACLKGKVSPKSLGTPFSVCLFFFGGQVSILRISLYKVSTYSVIIIELRSKFPSLGYFSIKFQPAQ